MDNEVQRDADARSTVMHRRPRRRPGENRERLVAAGIEEFGRHGYHGASTGAIAASAEVPQPHVYASFAAKRELFLACAIHVSQQLRTGSRGLPYARFLYQAVAALGDTTLGEALRPILFELRTVIGPRDYNDLLLMAVEDAHRR